MEQSRSEDLQRVRVSRHQDLRNRRFSMKQRSSSSSDRRSEGRRDSDRILYTQAWRRLAGVTQVLTPFEDMPLIHNRLTHSEKVAQVARSIADNLLANEDNYTRLRALGGVDADVVEAAGYAHDLGHPPFGHASEEVLDHIARSELGLPDGFEGNAQTLRILLVSEARQPDYDGVDLTAATIAAVAKYPWKRIPYEGDERHDDRIKNDRHYRLHWKKFGAYQTEWPVLSSAREFLLKGDDLPPSFNDNTQSLEASIMDVADDITYAVHDFEDFFLAGKIDARTVLDELNPHASGRTMLDTLANDLASDYAGWFDKKAFEDAVGQLYDELRYAPKNLTGRPDEVAWIRKFASNLIGRYLGAVTIFHSPPWADGPFIQLGKPEWHHMQVLKHIGRHFVIERHDLALLQRGQQRILHTLVDMLYEWVHSSKDRNRLPPRLLWEVQIAYSEAAYSNKPVETRYVKTEGSSTPRAVRGSINRCILDFLCLLTDGQCVALHDKLSGRNLGAPMTDMYT